MRTKLGDGEFLGFILLFKRYEKQRARDVRPHFLVGSVFYISTGASHMFSVNN